MTCEYRLADKLRNKYYIRNDMSQYGKSCAKKTNPGYGRRPNGDTVTFMCANGGQRRQKSRVSDVDPMPRQTAYYGKANRSGIKNDHRTGGRTNVGAQNKRASAYASERRKKAPMPEKEIKIKKKYLNPLYVACLFIVTVMMMSLVMCFSQVSASARDITKLERDLETLRTQETDLTEKLDEKNDMRLIETIATTKLGMVKEDSLQRKYISLSEGEYIELSEEDETNTATGGVMLSSILSSLDRLFDRFK